MSLRPDGTFDVGTFAGGRLLAEAMVPLVEAFGFDGIADILDVSPRHFRRILDGSAPLPMSGRYTRLLAELALAGAPLEPRLLYSWQRMDAAAWRAATGVSSSKDKEVSR